MEERKDREIELRREGKRRLVGGRSRGTKEGNENGKKNKPKKGRGKVDEGERA